MAYELVVTPTDHAEHCENLSIECYLYDKGGIEGRKVGEKVISTPIDVGGVSFQVDLGHFPFTGQHWLEISVTVNGKNERRSIADIEITSRANMQMAVIWFVLVSGFSFLMFLLGLFMGR